MSDRSYAQVVVYDCPEEQRAAARAAIFEAFGGESINEQPHTDTAPGSDRWDSARWVRTAELVLGERYGSDECSLDMNATLAAAIIEAAPGATFAAWVDPKYEYAGMLTMYSPDLGQFDSECDANGNATITSYRVRQILATNPPDAIAGALRAELGLTWDERIRAAVAAESVA